MDLGNNNVMQNRYIRGTSLIAQADSSSIKNYYLQNAHGDVVQLSNSAGSSTKNYSYDAFGIEKNIDSNDTNPFRYSGEYYDKETGNIYLRARYYDPHMGRFMNEDPIKDGNNFYTYCFNSPISLVDPSGLKMVWIRDYANEINGSVEWIEKERKAILYYGANGSKNLTFYADYQQIDKNGRMYIDDQITNSIIGRNSSSILLEKESEKFDQTYSQPKKSSGTGAPTVKNTDNSGNSKSNQKPDNDTYYLDVEPKVSSSGVGLNAKAGMGKSKVRFDNGFFVGANGPNAEFDVAALPLPGAHAKASLAEVSAGHELTIFGTKIESEVSVTFVSVGSGVVISDGITIGAHRGMGIDFSVTLGD